MRRFILPLVLLLLVTTACSKLPGKDDMVPDKLVSLENIPAEYGELVAVTFAPQPDETVGWREMWFENEETGKVTYVPVLLPEWKYYPKMVKTIDRP